MEASFDGARPTLRGGLDSGSRSRRGSGAFPCIREAGIPIRELTAPAGTRFYPNAIDGRGQIVGEISSHGGSTQKAAVYAGHLVDVGAPPGFGNSAGIGISYMGAVLVRAANPGRPTRPFVAEPHNSRYVWERVQTGIRGYYLKSVEGIDANGDLAGTVQRPGHSGSQRAAVWFPVAQGRYSHATMLPTAGQRHGTEASTIWSGGGRVVVAGSGQLWTRTGGGRFRVVFNTLGCPGALLEAMAIRSLRLVRPTPVPTTASLSPRKPVSS